MDLDRCARWVCGATAGMALVGAGMMGWIAGVALNRQNLDGAMIMVYFAVILGGMSALIWPAGRKVE